MIEELAAAGRRVRVGLEMYPYPEQRWLDDWSAGRLAEDAFLEGSRWYRNWGYNWLYYRDIFLFARDHRLRLFAINAPREVVSAVRQKGFQGLTPEEAAHIPTTDRHRRRGPPAPLQGRLRRGELPHRAEATSSGRRC